MHKFICLCVIGLIPFSSSMKSSQMSGYGSPQLPQSPKQQDEDPFSVALKIGEDEKLCARAVEEHDEIKAGIRARREKKGPITLAGEQCAAGLAAFKKLDPALQRNCPQAKDGGCYGVGGKGRRFSKCMVKKRVKVPWLKLSWYWKTSFKNCIKPLIKEVEGKKVNGNTRRHFGT